MGSQILWVDSDPGVRHYFPEFTAAGFTPVFCPEVVDAMNFIQKDLVAVSCVITSTMQRFGRKERGLPSGFDLADWICRSYQDKSYKPLLAFITASADEQECLEHGFTLYAKYERGSFVKKVISILRDTPNRDFRLARAVNVCGYASMAVCRGIVEGVLATTPGPSFEAYHNSFADLCFCTLCQPHVSYIMRAGEKYALPIGWFGFGIALRNDIAVNRSLLEGWPVAYHGFSPRVLRSMLAERRIMFPGDVLLDGTVLQMKHGQCWSKSFGGHPVIYLTPTICYASQVLYSPEFQAGQNRVQFAVQCRVRPGSFKKFPETLGRGSSPRFDPGFDNSEVEWVTDQKDAVIPYRLLISIH